MQGNVVALNQRDVYDSSSGASREYWEKKDVEIVKSNHV